MAQQSDCSAYEAVYGESRWLTSPGWGDMRSAESADAANRLAAGRVLADANGIPLVDALRLGRAQRILGKIEARLSHLAFSRREDLLDDLSELGEIVRALPPGQLAPYPWQRERSLHD